MIRQHGVLACAAPGRLRYLAWIPLALALLAGFLAGPAEAQQTQADVFVARAILAYEEKRYEEALAELRRALELDPTNVDAFYYTGLVWTALGRLEEAVTAFERGRALAPHDEAILFQLGVVYFSLKKYDSAQPLLEQLFAVRPSWENLGYYVGFMRYRTKNFQGALEAFRAGVSTDPNVQQLVRFYGGLALAFLGLSERAAAEIGEAVRLQPASPLTGPAERLREAILAARARERRFRVETRLGFLYDDNVPVNPEPSSRDPRVEELRQREQRSVGELAALRLEYAFLRIGSLETTVTYSFFTTYNNDLPGFNVVDYLGGLGGSYGGTLGTLPYLLELQYTYDYLTLDDDELVQRHTVAPLATLVESPNNLSVLQLRYQSKQFSGDTDIARPEKRDGTNWMAGLTHVFRFEGDKHLLRLGYQWDFDDTDGPNLRGRNSSYYGHRVLAGAQYTLPWAAVRLKYDFDVHIRDYRHRHTLLPDLAPGAKERFDKEFTHILGFALPLPGNFTLAADYQATVSRSNLDVFTFVRKVLSVVLIWAY